MQHKQKPGAKAVKLAALLLLSFLLICKPTHSSAQELQRFMAKSRTTPERAAAKAKKASLKTNKGTTPSATSGNADFTLPDPGNGVLIIPTPTFTYDQVHNSKTLGFQAKVWANALGTDSSYQRVANKLFVPQTSILGLQIEINKTLFSPDTTFTLGLVCDLNLLLKKISYLDTSAKNNFDPWTFHPRIGLNMSFYKNNLYAGFYYNFMSVLTNYDEFGNFFGTGGKNTFVFPEFNVGGIFNISGGGSQQLKFELDGIFNNKNVSMLYKQNTGVIISIKAGFVTNL